MTWLIKALVLNGPLLQVIVLNGSSNHFHKFCLKDLLNQVILNAFEKL